jgi:hypothetical protein
VRLSRHGSRSTGLIPIVISFDAEPNQFFIDQDQPEPWQGLDCAPEQLQPVRDRIEQRTGVPARFTWLIRLDEQIRVAYGTADWCLHAYSRQFGQLAAAGDQLGVHIHPYRLANDGGGWVHDYGNEDWVLNVTGSALDQFQKNFGHTAPVTSMGMGWMSTTAMNLLSSVGVQCDLTVTPGLPASPYDSQLGPTTGERPDTREVPRTPYRPASHDWRRADPHAAGGIVVVPGTVQEPLALPPAQYWPQVAWRKFRGHQPATNRLLFRLGPANYAGTVSALIRQQAQPLIVFQLRSAVCGSPPLMRQIEAGIDWLLQHPAADRFRFVTATEALDLLGYSTAPAGSISPGVSFAPEASIQAAAV